MCITRFHLLITRILTQVRKTLYTSGLTDIFSMIFSDQENTYEKTTPAPVTVEERAKVRAGEVYQFRSSDMVELSQSLSWRDWWRPDTHPRLIFSFALFHPNKGSLEKRAQDFHYYAACAVDFVRRKRKRWKDCRFVAHLGEDVGPTVMRNLYRAADGCMKILKYVVLGGENENNNVGAQNTFSVSHWRSEGHEFIGRRVRRDFDATGTIDGVITMWLPPMYDDLDLWRVQYVSLSVSLSVCLSLSVSLRLSLSLSTSISYTSNANTHSHKDTKTETRKISTSTKLVLR